MQEDPGERLSDSEEEDKTKNEHDSMIDVEEETENSFVVPNDYLSEDEVYLSYSHLSNLLRMSFSSFYYMLHFTCFDRRATFLRYMYC